MVEYEEVPAGEVPAGMRATAERMREFCVQDLALGPVVIRWFREYGRNGVSRGRRHFAGTLSWSRELWGLARSGERSIRISVDSPDVAATVAHECRHLYQFAHNPANLDREADARRYAIQAARAILRWPGDLGALKATDKTFLPKPHPRLAALRERLDK